MRLISTIVFDLFEWCAQDTTHLFARCSAGGWSVSLHTEEGISRNISRSQKSDTANAKRLFSTLRTSWSASKRCLFNPIKFRSYNPLCGCSLLFLSLSVFCCTWPKYSPGGPNNGSSVSSKLRPPEQQRVTSIFISSCREAASRSWQMLPNICRRCTILSPGGLWTPRKDFSIFIWPLHLCLRSTEAAAAC